MLSEIGLAIHMANPCRETKFLLYTMTLHSRLLSLWDIRPVLYYYQFITLLLMPTWGNKYAKQMQIKLSTGEATPLAQHLSISDDLSAIYTTSGVV